MQPSEPSDPRPTAAEDLRFPCKACGAELQFHIGGGELRCPYCGYSEVIPSASDQVVEHPLDGQATAGRPTGYGTAVRPLDCGNCGAHWSVDNQVTASSCPFCGAAQVQARPANAAPTLRPESVIPFQVTQEAALQGFRKWLAKLWFRPSKLRHLAVAGDIRGVYVPFWTFDAFTVSHWTAEAGYHYYDTETYATTNAQGQVETRTRTVQRTRWVPVHGRHDEFFDDILVPASQGIERGMAARVRPFDTRALVNFAPEYLVGLTAEDSTVAVADAWPAAESDMRSTIHAACRRAVPGDTQRNLHVRTSFHNRTFKLCLLPLWVASYRFQGKVYHYLCNGQTGKVGGQAPLSAAKIVGFVAAILGLIGGIAALVHFFG